MLECGVKKETRGWQRGVVKDAASDAAIATRSQRFKRSLRERGLTLVALKERTGISRTSMYYLAQGKAGKLVRMLVRPFLSEYERFLVGDMDFSEWKEINGNFYHGERAKEDAYRLGHFVRLKGTPSAK